MSSMSLTVELAENESVRLTDQRISNAPPAHVDVAVTGVLSMTEGLLDDFEGSSLKPVEIELSIEDLRLVEIDLSEQASLELESIEVGVATPDTDDVSPGADPISSSTDGVSPAGDSQPGAIAFTVEGTIRDVPDETCDLLADASPRLKAITFAVEDSIRSDGGADTDVVLDIGLLGYRLVIHRNGTVDIGTNGSMTRPF